MTGNRVADTVVYAGAFVASYCIAAWIRRRADQYIEEYIEQCRRYEEASQMSPQEEWEYYYTRPS